MTETITKAEVAKPAAGQKPAPTESLLVAAQPKEPAKQPVDAVATDSDKLYPETDDTKEQPDAAEPDKGEAEATGEADKAKADADGEIPEGHEFKLPDGETTTPKVLESYRTLARELGLPLGKAQTMLEKMLPVIRQESQTALQAKVAAQIDTWRQETIKDKEIGGQKLKESVEIGKEGLSHYFEASFIEWLDQSGGGNRADVIRGFAKLGRDLRSDAFVQGAARRGGAFDLNDPAAQARKLFPNDE